jgi:hypothetical protein
VDPVTAGLGATNQFIRLANELAKLPALTQPQYRNAARSLYQICQMLLEANENTARWLYKFLYFDFQQEGAGNAFNNLVAQYRTMKTGPELKQLKFRCGDIANIYYEQIQSKLGRWFTRQRKLQEAQRIFASLSSADEEMVDFISREVIEQLDAFVNEAEEHVAANDMNAAEESRLRYKAEFREVTERLETFSGELADLVVHFANIARTPVTLDSR